MAVLATNGPAGTARFPYIFTENSALNWQVCSAATGTCGGYAMAEATCTWTGVSGRQYTFHVVGLSADLEPGARGNYIYAKRNPDNTWRAIHVGHGDLSVRCSQCPAEMQCIKRLGATHVHVRSTAGGEETRAAVARDLLARYAEAHAPVGCTERATSVIAPEVANQKPIADRFGPITMGHKRPDNRGSDKPRRPAS